VLYSQTGKRYNIPMKLILKYLKWQFVEKPKEIIGAIKNFLAFSAYFFSLKQNIVYLFSPWKSITWSSGRGFDPQAIMESAFSNFISRIIGFFLRAFLIVACLVCELVIFVLGIALFLTWIFLPFIIIMIFVFSFKYV